MNVQINGQDVEVSEGTTCGEVLAKTLSGKKFGSVVAARAIGAHDPVILDLSAPVPEDCAALEPIVDSSPEGLEIIRHSTAHVMAAAVKKLFPDAKVAIGPAIENGFYYDFDYKRPFTDDDLAAIEKEMQRIAKEASPFSHSILAKAEAARLFRDLGENYKLEILDSIDDDKVGVYTCEDFTDLCRGPHVPHTGFAANSKLLSIAGAYWRGDEHNQMLSRVYGTAFADRKALAEHLRALEEAKRRDHRRLGRELALFDFEEEVAPGMVFWMPRGMLVRTILEDFWRREHLKRGYELVQGPQLLRVETWKKSGHYEHYYKNMYFTRIQDDDRGGKPAREYGIKPMNCIGHMLIYGHDLHSYRDLPKRYFELGVVHRHEKSGVLHGLMRVRQFTQDDAHIICAPEELEGEILGVINLVRALMGLFDFRFKTNISTRPKESIGTDEAWEMATSALTGAVKKAGLEYGINEGDGAFYGPKIDVSLLDSLGRQWQCSTIQVDFTLPERFDLVYVGKDGERHRPVMVHRAIMGSLERFIGILVEHYAGALPTWLAPEQARLLTVSDRAIPAALKMRDELREMGIRADADIRNEKLGFKVREAQVAKVPYSLVVGDKEVEAGGVSARSRDGKNLGLMTVAETAELVRADAESPFKKGGMSYSFT